MYMYHILYSFTRYRFTVKLTETLQKEWMHDVYLNPYDVVGVYNIGDPLVCADARCPDSILCLGSFKISK